MSVSPTYKGYVASTQDALILFEACLTGQLHHISRQLHEDERPSLVVSGNVFVYEQHSSGIVRWTDGIRWGAPEVVNDFHLYRQLVADLDASESDRNLDNWLEMTRSTDAGLFLGALNFPELRKYTISVTVRGISHHLVGYFTLSAALGGELRVPTLDPGLCTLSPREELLSQRFIAPAENGDDVHQNES
ncbi:Gti1/Pac2 family-domain-containing protein [Dactylonectria estremocensis]|uniref:Gti1/Pac2 family-domain-containing protein n=1 Tax=Dactylonectria estremocensis TaxID=1079267 RepID=A0A9P9DF65_9HYPO|nr:Gti1/Pac2 family-domain-containing protein [Dactylonectria estremocensis]